MSSRQKRILFLAYHFPPSRAIGGRRIAAFARYLQEFGWKSWVVTIKEEEIEQKDTDGLEKLQTVGITRAGKLPSLRNIYLGLKTKISSPSPAGKDKTVSGGEPAKSGKPGMKQKVKYFLAALVFLPDEHRNWILPAAVRSFRCVRRHGIDYILTSCPPYSTHLAGLLVKMVCGRRIRWIADFRDPWMVPNEKEIYPTTSFSKRIEYALEKLVIGRCDLVLTTTERLADRLAAYYWQQDRQKFQVVANGFEPDDLPFGEVEKYDVFTVSYTGSLYFGRTPEPLFEAVKRLLEDGKLSVDEICIKLVGYCQAIDGIPTRQVAERYGLQNVVEVVDSVPQSQAVEIIRKSHVALLLAPGQPYQIPGKSYEYIGLGTPILAITEEGATGDLINSVSSGRAVHPDDIKSIKQYLLERFEAREKAFDDVEVDPALFTRRKTVEGLAGFLERLP